MEVHHASITHVRKDMMKRDGFQLDGLVSTVNNRAGRLGQG